MSDAALDRGVYFSSSMTNWTRERPFKVAFAVSVVIHAALIAFIPGFRSVPVETPRILEVQIAPQDPPPMPPLPAKPVVLPKVVEPRIEPKPEPVVRVPQPEPVVQKPQPVPIPEPVIKQAQPESPPVPRAEIIRAVPRSEPTPEFVVPKPELRPEPKAEPKLEARPEPKIEPRPEPPPLARVEPRPEPRPTPRIEPRPDPRVEPRTEIRQEVKPVPADAPPPVAARRVEPSVAAPAVVPPPVPAPVTTQPPPVVAPQPSARKEQSESPKERALIEKYKGSISARIKSHENYPISAKRRHWEGTTVIALTLAPDGNVKNVSIFESSGRDVLDEAALNMVKQAAPLPQAPEEMRGEERTVTVPISFKLPDS